MNTDERGYDELRLAVFDPCESVFIGGHFRGADERRVFEDNRERILAQTCSSLAFEVACGPRTEDPFH